MKKEYIAPVAETMSILVEKFICQSTTTDKSSLGTAGGPNEQKQDDIPNAGQGFGPNISGAKINNIWSDWDD